jgi:hypothetical protein
MTPDDVQRWLDAYLEAWRSYEPAQIRALFSEESEHRYRPYGDAIVGADAIVDDWLSDRDEPGSWEAEYRPLAIAGSHAITTGETRYTNGDVYSNLWELEFDNEGRCSKFVEWFMKHP